MYHPQQYMQAQMPQQQMRTSAEGTMRMSGSSQYSNSANQYPQGMYPQSALRSSGGSQYSAPGTNPLRSSGSSTGSGVRDSRGSRGSSEGLRMSSGSEMAGVGIFFQQEPTTGRVYVANIVEGGSADRSGVIRINDVIVKVDDEDVQGQPLSTLRNLILGKQGTYVVLAFRRMTGTELYYYDVELVRGTPEYFESLKKSQAVQEEKEKLLNQVRQQEMDIQALRYQNMQTQQNGGTDSMRSSATDTNKFTEEITRLKQHIQRETEARDQILNAKAEIEKSLLSLRAQNASLSEAFESTTANLEQTNLKFKKASIEWQQNRSRLEAELQKELAASAANGNATESSEIENQKLRTELSILQTNEKESARKIHSAIVVMEEAAKDYEVGMQLLQELPTAMDTLNSFMFANFSRAPRS